MSFLEAKYKNVDFRLNDELSASFSFATETSISLTIHDVKTLAFRGWIDVHYPCDGHIRLQLRISIAQVKIEPIFAKKVVEEVMSKLGLVDSETCEAIFFKATDRLRLSRGTNQEGLTDRIDTSRKFTLPDNEQT